MWTWKTDMQTRQRGAVMGHAACGPRYGDAGRGACGMVQEGRNENAIKCLNLRRAVSYILMGKWNNFVANRSETEQPIRHSQTPPPLLATRAAPSGNRSQKLAMDNACRMQIKRAFNNLRWIHLGVIATRHCEQKLPCRCRLLLPLRLLLQLLLLHQ